MILCTANTPEFHVMLLSPNLYLVKPITQNVATSAMPHISNPSTITQQPPGLGLRNNLLTFLWLCESYFPHDRNRKTKPGVGNPNAPVPALCSAIGTVPPWENKPASNKETNILTTSWPASNTWLKFLWHYNQLSWWPGVNMAPGHGPLSR